MLTALQFLYPLMRMTTAFLHQNKHTQMTLNIEWMERIGWGGGSFKFTQDIARNAQTKVLWGTEFCVMCALLMQLEGCYTWYCTLKGY